MRWSKTSYWMLSGFILLLFIIGYVWWPLLNEYLSQIDHAYPIWLQLDWLLIGNFLVMSVLIMLNADLKHDIPFAIIALVGGTVIESWGTLSGLWTYYTFETPPLWILPAWPIAALSVNRLHLIFKSTTKKVSDKWFVWMYWPVFGGFTVLLLVFAWPTLNHPLTIFSVLICVLMILSAEDKHSAILIFAAGSLLGYFLERLGTTRLCWTYYTGGTPPIITVLAHGMASVALWRVFQIYLLVIMQSDQAWLKALIPNKKPENY